MSLHLSRPLRTPRPPPSSFVCHYLTGVNRCPLVSDIKVAECKGLGQPCTLSCSITNFYPKDIKVTWQRTGDKGPDITAVPSECQSGKQSYQLEAKATFVPKTQSDLEEVEYICRVEHETLNGQYFERRTGKTGQRDLLCCPVVSDIETIKCAKLSQPCVLGCSIRDFYPEEIEVTWLRRDLKTGNEFHSGTAGWTAEVDAKQEKQNNNTYSVKTQVTFTPETLNDVEEVEYICRVQHKSLSTPVDKHSGRIQITGLVQKPKVSEVEVNFIQFYQPCILTCQVSDFYPKEISITWEKKKKMMKGLLKCVDEWRPLVTQDGPSWNNYRYTLESRAEFTPQSQADLQDMEFICRVEHSSLRGPVEKQGSFAAVLALTGLQAKGSGDQEDQPQNRASEKRKTPKEPADDSKTESPSG
ncbi:IGG2B protein, partial [Polypterus senegalus]